MYLSFYLAFAKGVEIWGIFCMVGWKCSVKFHCICLGFVFIRDFKKTGNFAKYILLGHKGCHRSQTLLSGQPLKSQNYFTSWHFCKKKEPRLDISRLHRSWIWNFAEILSSNLFLYHCLTQVSKACKIWERPCNCSVLLNLARFRRSVETHFSCVFFWLIDFCQFQQNFHFSLPHKLSLS